MKVMLINGKPVKIWADEVDDHAMKEIENLATLPFVFHHLAFMPDVHGGMGMPIGGVLATDKVVVPNAVGVDIGCGILTVQLKETRIDLPKFDSVLHEVLPCGFDRRLLHHNERDRGRILFQQHGPGT